MLLIAIDTPLAKNQLPLFLVVIQIKNAIAINTKKLIFSLNVFLMNIKNESKKVSTAMIISATIL